MDRQLVARRVTVGISVLLAAVLAGCGSSTPEVAEQPAGDRASVEYLYSADLQRDSYRFVETSTQECLLALGFLYEQGDPFVAFPSEPNPLAALAAAYDADKVAEEGYGISDLLYSEDVTVTEAPASEFQIYLLAMSDGERETFDQNRATCRDEATVTESQRRGQFFVSLPTRAQELLTGIEMGSTSEYSDALEAWSSCVADQGLGNFALPVDAREAIEAELVEILFPQGFDLDPSKEAQAEALRHEVSFAIGERACFAQTIGTVVRQQIKELDEILKTGGFAPDQIFEQ